VNSTTLPITYSL